MKKFSFSFFLMLLFFTAVKAQTPLQFNDDIAGVTDSLQAKGQRWGAALSAIFKSKEGNYSSLKAVSDNLLAYISITSSDIKNRKDVKNSKPLRMAMLEFLDYEKQLVIEGFVPFEKFNAGTTGEVLKAAVDKLTEKAASEDEYLKKVTAAQYAYAAENGFTIASE